MMLQGGAVHHRNVVSSLGISASDSLKAYMVAPFADMPREEITLA